MPRRVLSQVLLFFAPCPLALSYTHYLWWNYLDVRQYLASLGVGFICGVVVGALLVIWFRRRQSANIIRSLKRDQYGICLLGFAVLALLQYAEEFICQRFHLEGLTYGVAGLGAYDGFVVGVCSFVVFVVIFWERHHGERLLHE